MPACFAVLGSIASTTRNFANDVRAQAKGHFIFELKKIGNTCWRFKNKKITLILQKGTFSPILSFKHVIKSSDNLPKRVKL